MSRYSRDSLAASMDTTSSPGLTDTNKTALPEKPQQKDTDRDTVTISFSIPISGIDDIPVPDSSIETSGRKPQKNTKQKNYPVNFEIDNIDADDYPDEIKVRALVYDDEGRYIYGLAPPHYKKDDWRKYWSHLSDSCLGKDHSIDDYQVEEIREGKGIPYSIAFILDHSGSMGLGRTMKLQQAVKVILYAIKKGDYVASIKFASKIYREVPLTADRAEYRNEFRVGELDSEYGGGTAFYDGTIAGIEEVNKAPATHRKVLILFSDGMDNESDADIDSVKKLAYKNDISLYTIAYGHSAEKPLRELAEFTGGRFYQIFSSKEFPYVFRDIYFTLNNYYLITYKPPRCEDLHRVKAELSAPGTGLPPMTATDYYDMSMFTKYDPVGTTAFVNIEFEFGKAEIKDESIPLIRKVARSLKNNPEMRLNIAGHTDDVGEEEYNRRLSEKRAKAVFDKLVEMGIDPDRLETIGYGETRPLAPNTSEENRRRNRRTEFSIIK
jgi:VWFA-related protein